MPVITVSKKTRWIKMTGERKKIQTTEEYYFTCSSDLGLSIFDSGRKYTEKGAA